MGDTLHFSHPQTNKLKFQHVLQTKGWRYNHDLNGDVEPVESKQCFHVQEKTVQSLPLFILPNFRETNEQVCLSTHHLDYENTREKP